MSDSPLFSISHKPVLYQEILHILCPKSPGKYVDATVGAGGHAWGILNASQPDGKLLGLDLDPQALEIAFQRLDIFQGRVQLVQASYTTLRNQLDFFSWDMVDGILFDLGVSSMELDDADRGFSFLADGPLDMRFDPGNPTTADLLVNQLPETELADLIWRYGDEPQSRRLARAIVDSRPLHSTLELAEVIRKTYRGARERIHPATRTFQALRIAVNQELEAIENVLPVAAKALAPGGRMAVISFHSLEDRIVKNFFRKESTDCLCPPTQPVCTCGHRATLRLLTHHSITAKEAEILSNPRARSARLRAAEKLTLA